VEATLHIKIPRICGGPVKVPTIFGGHLIIFIGTRCKILPLLRSRQIFMLKVKPLAMGFTMCKDLLQFFWVLSLDTW
jgi:hypothetical protein